ncbi:hypothetical protein DY123_07480 [Apilactobacillus micheneri]|uniref:hypothetical protein n=1 Tax=Apilactobacillus micheneri TaxID=1899430 RepID=UPI00112BBF4C|nr:hypothetical protein [Apilactobacillus micheneri]TPR41221.1 hypothetical protein DY123_07480 [Apilactobacillus micheneri]
MKIKKFILTCATTLMISGSTIASASAMSNDSNVNGSDNTTSGKAYDSDISTKNEASSGSRIIKVPNKSNDSNKFSIKMAIPVADGTFSYGVGGIINYYQFAKLNCKGRHKVRAMMNDESVTSPIVGSHKTAYAETPSHFGGYSTNNSYYELY